MGLRQLVVNWHKPFLRNFEAGFGYEKVTAKRDSYPFTNIAAANEALGLRGKYGIICRGRMRCCRFDYSARNAALQEADLVIYAGSLVNPELLSYTKKGCECLNSAYMTLDEVIDALQKGEEEGKKMVRLHTGDPSIYGAIREQMDRLEELGIGYETCPGVTACFGAAGGLNLELTVPEVSQSIITRMAGRTTVPEKGEHRKFCRASCDYGSLFECRSFKRIIREIDGRRLQQRYTGSYCL